uniref:Uncharacterized LOC107557583 n=3 Tax=Sinocyclocheilus grahami TaxID=75366 RepID=A0A672KAL4_SINGR
MVPEKMTAPKCPSETSKRSQKGRKKKPIQPNEKEVAAKNVCSDGLDNSEHNSCPEQHLSSQKTKGTCYRHSKKTPNNQTPSDVSTALHTCTTLSPLHHKKSSTCHTNSDCSSIPHTPKRCRPRSRPLFSSTPTSDLQPFSPKRAKNSCTPHQNIKKSSLVKTPPTDRTPSRRVRHQKPVAAGRPRGRKKKNVEEQPIASPPVKRGRKSAASRLESPQEEPSIEMPPPNKADFETQVSEPQESGCPVRRKYSERKSLLTFPIQEILGMECDNSDNNTEDIVVEEQDQLLSKKVLPDRSKTARNRANKQLVDFIIRRKTPPTDRTPSRRVRHQKPAAAGRPRGRKKKNVEEQPIASPPVKRGRKSAASRLESPQEEPSIEMPPPNKADFETQVSEPQESGCPVRRKYSERKSLLTFPIQEILGMECENSDNNTEDIVVEEQDQLLSKKVLPDRSKAARNRANKQLVDFIIRRKTPPTDRTPSRRVRHQKPVAAGRPRGRKKKNVEEQPIASPPVKRGRKSVASRLESPQEEPSIEMPPPNKADFETQVSEPQESDQNMSSDLSIELSLQEEPHPLNNSLFMEEEEEEEDLDEEEEELPSFLQQDNKRPLSISEGFIVWCKLRKYPYWPAVVKSVNRKNKKASIVFIDCYLIDQKRIRKGFSVSLRTLKPFDCEEYEKLVDIAEEKYGNAITWSLELISDYRIRIGCGSFSGSFIEYCAADISCPVRRKYSERKSLLTFPIQEILGMECENSDNNTEDIVVEEQDQLLSKKVLPDRSKTARNRANKQLVDFIIRRKVESRLLAVISGRESSKWMQALQKPSRPVVDVYLEDEEQVDKVYRYLNKVCDSAPQINTCLENIQADRIRLILDVLLPEAIIYAIAGVHKLSLENAEEKYRRGPCFSNRERQEFDMMIEQQMKLKEITWHHRQ